MVAIRHGGFAGTVLSGSTTQRHRYLTSYRERKRRSSRTHLLAQSTGGATVEKKEGGSFNGAGDSQFGENRSRAILVVLSDNFLLPTKIEKRRKLSMTYTYMLSL